MREDFLSEVQIVNDNPSKISNYPVLSEIDLIVVSKINPNVIENQSFLVRKMSYVKVGISVSSTNGLEGMVS